MNSCQLLYEKLQNAYNELNLTLTGFRKELRCHYQPARFSKRGYGHQAVRAKRFDLILILVVFMFTFGTLLQTLHFEAGMAITELVFYLLPALLYLKMASPAPAVFAGLNRYS